MKPITAGFRLPSLREACQRNDAQRTSDPAAAVQTLALPYGVGKATLQLTGIHVRLQPVKHPRSAKASAFSAPAAVVGAIAADIVVHAHVRGALNTAPRTFVIAVVPVRYDASHNADGTPTGKAPLPLKDVAASSSTSATASAPYDKRVLNAQAREARRGVVAPVFASSFAKVDVRTQMERVRLSFTVVPYGKLSTGAAHRGKRGREGEEEGADAAAVVKDQPEQPQASLVDCLVDVTVVGTISPIA